MLIDLRELLSGSQDEKSYKADIEMNTLVQVHLIMI